MISKFVSLHSNFIYFNICILNKYKLINTWEGLKLTFYPSGFYDIDNTPFAPPSLNWKADA